MSQILGVMLTVADLDKMTAFFTEVLSFEKVENSQLEGASYDRLYEIPNAKARFVMLRLGAEPLYLIAFDPPGNPYPSIRSHDHLFQHIAIVVSDLERAHQRLSQYGVTAISEGPVTIPEWNGVAAGIQAFYFRSPEGHPLELISFPPQKGRPVWQRKEHLFLGIDHTAMTVSHTRTSRHFYQDVLGMTCFGESLNYGSTQEALSGVSEAKVQITGLGYPGAVGMSLECLHYLNPTHGRPAPILQSNDLGCTYTVIAIDHPDRLRDLPLTQGVFVNTTDAAMRGQDPDGHRLLFVSKQRK